MQSRRRLFRLAALGLAPTWRALGLAPAIAQTQQNLGDDVVAVVANASAMNIVDVTARLDEQMSSYLEESGLARRERAKELSVARGTADVRVNASNPDWVRFRSLAYERAYADAQTNYLTSQGLRVVSSVANELFRAAGEEPPPFDAGPERAAGQLNDLFRKLIGVADARVTQILREANVDPQQYEVAPPPQRYVQLRDAFRRTTTRRVIGELSGMLACKTFEGHDGQGNFVISVIAVVSPRLRDFAQEVRRRRGDLEPNLARAGNPETIIANKDDLVRQFGVRQLFDTEGNPVLVGFGQWAAGSLGANAGTAVMASLDRAAVSQARAMADAALGYFLSSNAGYEETGTVGDAVEQAVNRMPNNEVLPDGAATPILLDGLRQKFQARSGVDLVGLTDLGGVWRHKHPITGRYIIGVVRMWSASGERAMRAMRDRRPPAATVAPGATPPSGPPGSSSGRTLMRSEDF